MTVVGVKRAHRDFTYATPDTVIEPTDLIIVAGDHSKVEVFSDLA